MGHQAMNDKGVAKPEYLKYGYKLVDRKKLAKDSKGFDYNDLWGSTYDY